MGWYVNPHQTFDAVTQELYPIPYMVSYRAARSESISFGRRLSTTTILLVIRPSSPVTSDTWLPVWCYPDIRRSFYDITVPTERGIEPERKKRRRLTNTKQVVTLRKM
jgi:hypothetical protein